MSDEATAAQGAGRYAPSPSGDLHLGNLRTALVAWLAARSSGRSFFMRIEDLDRERDSGHAQSQLADLAEIGLDWDGQPVYQSERTDLYAAALQDLADRGLVYECYCTRKDILAAPSAPHSPPGSYPGTCRELAEAQRAGERARIAPRQPALRLAASHESVGVTFTDALKLAPVSAMVDDMVLRRGDGTFAYNLAVVVDDGQMSIDQVVRGDDLLLSTPRQIYLQRLLGLPQPEYLHVPLVLGPEGRRLAKRDGAVTLKQLRSRGVDAGKVVAWMGWSLGLSDRSESPSVTDLLERFAPEELNRDAWAYREHEKPLG